MFLNQLTVHNIYRLLEACPLVDLTAQIEEPIRCGGGAYGDVYKCRLSDSSSIVSRSIVYPARMLNFHKVAVKSLRYFVDDQERAERLKKVGVLIWDRVLSALWIDAVEC